MDCQYVPLDTTGQFSRLFLDYIAQAPSLSLFYNRFPEPGAFAGQIQEKQSFPAAHRQALVSALERQYAHVANPPNVGVFADATTFAVTTGHQLNLFTGPLYVVYKLVTTINLARRLKQQYPAYTFVPVYWMASEDHDFAEINHFRLFGRTHAWHTDQRGAVGRMNPRELSRLLAEIPEKLPLFEEAYLTHDTLADAVRHYVHALFGAEGLVCIDGDDAELKRLFAPIMRDDLRHQTAGELVQQRTAELEALGYDTVISPRDINLFYLADGLRERIVRDHDGTYRVLHTQLRFSEADILAELDVHPERFSPNVVLRPVYQETILPNLAYIGGPSEVPYWLQLKGVFDRYAVPFPVLMPRNFALYVPLVSARRWHRLGFSPDEWFLDEMQQKRLFIERHTAHALTFDGENRTMHKALDAMLHKAMRVDPTLERAVLAETKRFANAVHRLEKKMRRAEERNQETGIRQLLAVRQELFPNGSPQERSENFLTFYLSDRQFLQKLLSQFDPFDFRMQVCLESQPAPLSAPVTPAA